jgi:hypothetical protein
MNRKHKAINDETIREITILAVSLSVTIELAGDGLTEAEARAAAETLLDEGWEFADARRLGRDRVKVRFVGI